MAQVTLSEVRKSYGAVELFRGVDLEIDKGEFVVFVGPSGSGKSTLLRMVAGLEPVTDGSIGIDGQDVTHAEPSERGIAMVFQNYALYPHMNVFGNIAFNLRLSRLPKSEVHDRVIEAARILRLEDLLDRSPAQLSGAPLCATRKSFCLMSLSQTWTPPCACRCGWRSKTCTGNWVPP